MPGKKKQPGKTYNPNWGGSRDREPAPFKRQAIRINCTDEEMQMIVRAFGPRQRALILLQAARLRPEGGRGE